MIAIRAVLSTSAPALFRPLAALLLVALLLGGCAVPRLPPRDRAGAPPQTSGYFAMTDGTRLPYRVWMPDAAPRAVVLALHGMNDSRDAWEYPGPEFAEHGIGRASCRERVWTVV